jgi:hypothetical protein
MEKLGAADPQRIGAYRLLARLGAGGMGQVFWRVPTGGGRSRSSSCARNSPSRRSSGRASGRRCWPRGGWAGTGRRPSSTRTRRRAIPWVATGYVAGPESRNRSSGATTARCPERSVRILAAGLAHALKDIHAAGMIHRDLKPSNVLVTIDGPRVIDFGIARALETVTDGGLTRTGALVGSPGFMAPEQVRGDRITPACDVFCLGSVLVVRGHGRPAVRYGQQRRARPDVPHRPGGAGPVGRPGGHRRPRPPVPAQGPGLPPDPRRHPRPHGRGGHRLRTAAAATRGCRGCWWPNWAATRCSCWTRRTRRSLLGLRPQAPSGAGPRTPAPQTPEGLISARPAFEDEAAQAEAGVWGRSPQGREGARAAGARNHRSPHPPPPSPRP